MTSSDYNLTVSWKRPWTIEEIIQSSQCWSLAADSGVCELLKSFSTDLLNEVAQVNNNINELSVESNQTNVIIQNAFNEFCMLANNQFMENLVEDVASCSMANENIKNNTESYLSKEDKLAQIIPQVTESLKMGLQVLENQFEIMDMQKIATTANPDESDTEMRSYAQVDYLTNEPIYHPKDPYENRHLPHLIGTKAFIEDETLGIGYLDDLENQSESYSAPSENGNMPDDLTSSFSSDNAESDDNEDPPRAIKKVKSSSESGGDGMFSEDNQSENDLFDENKGSNLIKNPDTNASLSKPLSIMDQLNNQLKQRLGVENIDNSNLQIGNSLKGEDNQQNDSSPIESHNDELKKKLPLQQSANHITRTVVTVSGNSADEDSDDLFGEVSTNNKMKNESKPVSNSLTKMPSVITSTPNNVDKNSNMKPKDNPLFDSDSDELFAAEPVVPKPAARSTKSSNLNPTVVKESIDRREKENQNQKEVPTKTIPNKTQPKLELESESDDDLFGPTSSKPLKSTAPIVKPISKKIDSDLFNSDDDGDLFNTTSKAKPHPKNTDKSNNVTSLPKVETDKKINTQKNETPKEESDKKINTQKKETPKSKPFSIWLDSSSDDDILQELPKPKLPAVSKPLNDDTKMIKESDRGSIKQENSEIKVIENIKSENVEETIQTNNSNSSSNNLEEINEDKNIDDFDTLFGTDKKEDKTSSLEFKNSKIITVDTNVSNNSKIIDPLAPPKRKISFNISNNSDEDVSNKSPVIIPRSSLDKNHQSSPSSGVLDASVPENSNSNQLDIVSDMKSFRESLSKLPPGARPIFGSSLMDEMKNHQKTKLSLNSESDPHVKDSSHLSTPNKIDLFTPNKIDLFTSDKIDLFTPNKIDLFGSFENQTESNTQSNKQDFKDKLKLKLNENLLKNPVERVNKPVISEENGINLEIPPEEVNQLTLLTKTRVKANPRRRPTMKKAGNGDTIPILEDPVIPENKIDSIPQPIVDSVPIIDNNQSDDTSNIFADLPSKPIKKSKSNKKSTAPSTNKTKKPIEVNVEEIDDIFTVATSKPKKPKNKSKIVSDPLGAL